MSKIKIRNMMDLGGRGLTLDEIQEVIDELSDPFVQAFWDISQLSWGPIEEICLMKNHADGPWGGLLITDPDKIAEYQWTHDWAYFGCERLTVDHTEHVVYLTRFGRETVVVKCRSVYLDHAVLFSDLALKHPYFEGKCEVVPWEAGYKKE
jgi:hypothetical protein